MTALGAVSHVTGPIRRKEGLAQAGTRCNTGDGPSGNGVSRIDGLHVARPQNRNSAGDRLQVANEMHPVEVEVQFLGERGVFNHPRQGSFGEPYTPR